MVVIRTAHLAFAFALAALVTPALVHAQAGAVIVYGAAKPHQRQLVATAITRSVREASWTIDDNALTQQETDDIITCLALDRPWACVAPIAKAKHIERIIVVQAEPDGRSVVIVGQILLDSTAVPAIERRYCDPCSDMALDQFVQELTTVLLERTKARGGTTAIEIHTVPRGASVTIDESATGTSDTTMPVAPGQHHVVIQMTGYRPRTELVTVLEGQLVKLSSTLVAEPVVSAADKPSRLVPLLVGGAGAIALVGGSVYSFTRDPPSSLEQPRYLYSGPAIAVAGAGGVALAVGFYLWLRQSSRSSSPTASLVSHGGVVGWSASF